MSSQGVPDRIISLVWAPRELFPLPTWAQRIEPDAGWWVIAAPCHVCLQNNTEEEPFPPLIFNRGISGIGIFISRSNLLLSTEFGRKLSPCIRSFILLQNLKGKKENDIELLSWEFFKEILRRISDRCKRFYLFKKIPSFEMELLTFVYGIQICFSQKTFSKTLGNSKGGKNSRKFLHIREARDKFAISFLPFTLKPLSLRLRFSLPI